MKHIIDNLSTCEVLADRLVFRGRGGEIVLGLYEAGVIRVSCRFAGAVCDSKMEAASAFITQGKAFAPWKGSVLEEEERFLVSLEGGLSIRLEKRNGILSLYKEDVLLHGGRIGSADLVVPEYPIRLITNGDQRLGHFNFPLHPADEFYGLGDKGGLPDRRGQRYAMFNRDSLAYEPDRSDPLYKSVPFFIKINRQTKVCLGVLFPLPGIRTIDFGRESRFYYSAEAKGGPFDYCLFTGEHYAQVLGAYCRLTGLPALAPRYSFGFLGSSMNYLEPDDAPQRVLDYFARTEKEGIPCEGMYFSSGYLKAPDGKRYALVWNREKFPNHGEFMRALARRGYHIIMNLKPGILCTHPWFRQLDEKGYLIKDASGKTYVEYFWGGAASFIDFTNPEAAQWWKDQLREQYLDHGCAGIWNDNNELELEDSELPIYNLRSQYPALMARASYEAFKEYQPHIRPWIYSRAGSSGLQRYARTWTGDNLSDFKTLRYNQYMGLSLGLSGLPFYGHDLGGFFGEVPEEELLLRSCETAVFQPRFVIHSWRWNGEPTEPWTYPDAFPRIKKLIYAHYRYMPYIYDCAVQASLTGYPIERMLRLEFPQDMALSEKDVNMLCGPFVLKVQAVDKGLSCVSVRLPQGAAWYDPRTDRAYLGGQSIAKEVPIDGDPHFLIRLGAVIPTAVQIRQLSSPLPEETDILIYPCLPGETGSFDHYEDDGITELALEQYNQFRFELGSDVLAVRRLKHGLPCTEKRLHRLVLPEGFVFAQSGENTYVYDPEDVELEEPLRLQIKGAWKLN